MKAEKLPSGSYRFRTTINGKRRSFVFDHKPTVKEMTAAADAEKRIALIEKGTFQDYARKYIAIKENVLSPPTIRSYETMLRNMSPEFLNKQLSQMTAADVQSEINQIAAKRSPKTCKNYHGFIAPVINMFRPDLALHTTLPMNIRKEVRIPTDEEVKAILDYSKGKSYELAFQLGIYGLRRSEACAVTAADLNGNMLTINKALVQDKDNKFVLKNYTKTESSTRTIYVSDYVAELLKEKGIGFDGYPDKIIEYLHMVQKNLGIERFKYHALRHYYASMAHSLGIPDAYIMAAGGWSSDNVLKNVYRHAQKDKELEMMEKVSKYISKLN